MSRGVAASEHDAPSLPSCTDPLPLICHPSRSRTPVLTRVYGQCVDIPASSCVPWSTPFYGKSRATVFFGCLSIECSFYKHEHHYDIIRRGNYQKEVSHYATTRRHT